jgi:hypothetical protein
VDEPYLGTLPWLTEKLVFAMVPGSSGTSESSVPLLGAELVLFDILPDDPTDKPCLVDDVIGIRTVRTACGGVLISGDVSALLATCSSCRRIALDNDVVLRSVEDIGVPLSFTTLRGKGLFARVCGGEAVGSLARISASPVLPARTCLPTSSTTVEPLRLFCTFTGEGGNIDASSLSSAFVNALNFIGIGISSSELSLSEYWRAWFAA